MISSNSQAQKTCPHPEQDAEAVRKVPPLVRTFLEHCEVASHAGALDAERALDSPME